MNFEPRDAPYPELKKSHTMARTGRPFTDVKPPPAAPVWAAIEGLARYHVLLAAIELGVFDAVRDAGCAEAGELAERLGVSAAPGVGARWRRRAQAARQGQRATPPTTRPGATSSATARPAWRSSYRWRRARSTTGRLADTVRRGRLVTPIEDDPAAFYVPLVEGTFTTMWRTAKLDRMVRYATSGPAPRCSTSVPAASRGRSPCSPPVRTGTPSSTTSIACSTSPAALPPSTA